MIQSFRNTTLHYGTLSGLAGFTLFVVLHLAGSNPLGRLSWWGAWIPVLFICLATRRIRNDVFGGTITYWQAYKAGVLTAFFGALLFALLAYVFGKLVFPDLLEIHRGEMLEDMEASRMIFSQDMYEQGVENIRKLTMALVAYNDFTMKMLGGITVSFITAAVYRNPPLPSAHES